MKRTQKHTTETKKALRILAASFFLTTTMIPLPLRAQSSQFDAFTTTVQYVTEFYPLWFTYYQWQVNTLVGASNSMVTAGQVTPQYHFVVAINDDTLYSSIYADLRAEPVVITIRKQPLATQFCYWMPTGTRYGLRFNRKRRGGTR